MSPCLAHRKRLADGRFVDHDLAGHLQKTAELAASFLGARGGEWAHLAGRWHDLGKYSREFQDYIRRVTAVPAAGSARVKVSQTLGDKAWNI